MKNQGPERGDNLPILPIDERLVGLVQQASARTRTCEFDESSRLVKEIGEIVTARILVILH